MPPGPRADLDVFAQASVQEAFAARPIAPFPASIAAVRVQAPGYSNLNLERAGGQHGQGRYTVIMTREVDEQDHFDRVARLPEVAGLTGLNRILLPKDLRSDLEIREAAARLQTDLVFLYTFDTAFFDRDASRPLTVITLGLSPTRSITALTTVSALLMDTRTGYIYATFEATERITHVSTSWSTPESADSARRKTEGAAFSKVIDEFVGTWPEVVRRHRAPVVRAP